MTNYARMYRFGVTPWERYATAAAASIAARLDREETGRSRPLGRALDLGCGHAPSRYATTAAALTALASNGSSAACGSAWCFR